MKGSVVWTCVKVGYGLTIGVVGGLLTVSYVSRTLKKWTEEDSSADETKEEGVEKTE